METKRLKSVIESQSSNETMSYCIIRSKLKRRIKKEHPPQAEVGCENVDKTDYSLNKLEHLLRFTNCQQQSQSRCQIPTPTQIQTAQASPTSSSQQASQTLAILPVSSQAKMTSQGSPSSLIHDTPIPCQSDRSFGRNDQLPKIKRQSSSSSSSKYRGSILSFPLAFNWSFIISLTFICLSATNWRLEPSTTHRHAKFLSSNPSTTTREAFYNSFVDLIFKFASPAKQILFNTGSFIQFAEAQYRPEWPSKSLQQEIFLLNLEDGYFGCQVNDSQDFLQLFELSKLCDGQAQCYQGTDEMATPLKCNNRERCGTYQNSRGQQDSIQCVNGVCLDGLCYCNDGFGGKSCDVPDENECKFRPCDVFAHCTNTMGSYYCSCFPGKSLVSCKDRQFRVTLRVRLLVWQRCR